MNSFVCRVCFKAFITGSNRYKALEKSVKDLEDTLFRKGHLPDRYRMTVFGGTVDTPTSSGTVTTPLSTKGSKHI